MAEVAGWRSDAALRRRRRAQALQERATEGYGEGGPFHPRAMQASRPPALLADAELSPAFFRCGPSVACGERATGT